MNKKIKSAKELRKTRQGDELGVDFDDFGVKAFRRIYYAIWVFNAYYKPRPRPRGIEKAMSRNHRINNRMPYF